VPVNNDVVDSLVFTEYRTVPGAHFYDCTTLLQFSLFPLRTSIDSATNKRFGNRELWKRVASRLVLQGRTVLVAHIVVREMKIVNVNAFFRHLEAI
jgi:hypothetical protein